MGATIRASTDHDIVLRLTGSLRLPVLVARRPTLQGSSVPRRDSLSGAAAHWQFEGHGDSEAQAPGPHHDTINLKTLYGPARRGRARRVRLTVCGSGGSTVTSSGTNNCQCSVADHATTVTVTTVADTAQTTTRRLRVLLAAHHRRPAPPRPRPRGRPRAGASSWPRMPAAECRCHCAPCQPERAAARGGGAPGRDGQVRSGLLLGRSLGP